MKKFGKRSTAEENIRLFMEAGMVSTYYRINGDFTEIWYEGKKLRIEMEFDEEGLVWKLKVYKPGFVELKKNLYIDDLVWLEKVLLEYEG